jgi:hypothetical protein
VWGEERNAYKIFVGECEEKKVLGKLSVGGRIILKWNFKK